MSGFTRSTADEELRVRAGQAFQFTNFVTSTVVNPFNVIVFNPVASGKVIIIDAYSLLTGTALSFTLYSLNTDPGLAAQPAAKNRLLGGSASIAVTEGAIAATPANTGVLLYWFLLSSAQDASPRERLLILPSGTGLNFQFGTIAATPQFVIYWYELPA